MASPAYTIINGLLVARDFIDEALSQKEDGTSPSPVFPSTTSSTSESRITELMVTITTLVTVTAMVVFARISARTVFAGGLGVDDWTIIVALILSGGQAACNYLAIQNGFLGRHMWDIDFANLNLLEQTKVGYASQLIYVAALYFTRISIVFFLARLFPARRILHLTIGGITTSAFLAQIFAYAFQCKYPQWEFIGGDCVNQTALYYSVAVIGVLLDFMLLITPIVLISRLNLENRQKIALIFVFALGVFVCITGIIRMTTLDGSTTSDDVSWYASAVALWSQIEVNVGIICASLPALKPLFRSFFGDKRLSLDSTDSSGTGRIAVIVVEKEILQRV